MQEIKDQTMNILTAIKSNTLISDRLKLVIEILSIYNPRINEILNTTYSNFYPEKYLILPGEKKSGNVIIRDRTILKEISELKPNGSNYIFYPIKYYSVYQFIKNNFGQLYNKLKTKKNNKITHAYRYINVEPLANINQITDVLHHKSIRSAKYYKKNIKEKT